MLGFVDLTKFNLVLGAFLALLRSFSSGNGC